MINKKIENVKAVETIRASLLDISELQKICKETYTTYFSDYWEKNGLELYLENQFGTSNLKADLDNKAIGYYFINLNSEAIGFLKINFEAAIEEFGMEGACELEKMYIYPKHKGKGIGKIALNLIIDNIRNQKKKLLFLDVLDTNEGGIIFYKKLGFKFHSKTHVKAQHFIPELSGLIRMSLELNP